MVFAALGLMVLGLSAGLMSRLKVLLLLVCAILLFSIGFSLRSGFSFLGTVAIVVIAQTILQGCYLLGVVIHALLSPLQVAQSESEAEAMDPAGSASANAFGRSDKPHRLLRPFVQGTVRSR
jgi:hypothetical protein